MDRSSLGFFSSAPSSCAASLLSDSARHVKRSQNASLMHPLILACDIRMFQAQATDDTPEGDIIPAQLRAPSQAVICQQACAVALLCKRVCLTLP